MALSLLTALAAIGTPDYDVVVYGSTPAGVAAATAAGHLGMKVALFEPLKVRASSVANCSINPRSHTFLPTGRGG